jgi:hypothetical protein
MVAWLWVSLGSAGLVSAQPSRAGQGWHDRSSWHTKAASQGLPAGRGMLTGPPGSHTSSVQATPSSGMSAGSDCGVAAPSPSHTRF